MVLAVALVAAMTSVVLHLARPVRAGAEVRTLEATSVA
jgi:hypothetical protein